jgi:hypothetical protein
MRHHLRFAVALPILVLCLAAPGAAQTRPPIDNASLRIILSPTPAVLIRIDGDPVYRLVEGTELQRIVNTTSFIVREPWGTYYLKVRHGWMEAYGLTGDWTVAGAPPDGDGESLRRAVSARGIDVLDIGERPDPDFGTGVATGPVPTIYVSTVPTELIVTDGPARFVPFVGTSLEYVENTTAHVFREPTDGEFFVFASGRWYRSWTTDGPWRLAVTRDLPADLASIPGSTLERNATSRP